MTLEQARKEIDSADKEMASLFEKRMKAVGAIISYKVNNNLQIYDADREEQVMRQNCKFIGDETLVEYYREFLFTMMDISKKYQRRILDNQQAANLGQCASQLKR